MDTLHYGNTQAYICNTKDCVESGVHFSAMKLLKHLSKPKDLVELDKKSKVVYKIPCKDCNVSNIGETNLSKLEQMNRTT